MVQPEIVPQLPMNILDFPAWDWVGAARAAPRPQPELPLDAIFSSFPPGSEPEVWPALSDDGFFFFIFVLLVIAFLIGITLNRAFFPERRTNVPHPRSDTPQ